MTPAARILSPTELCQLAAAACPELAAALHLAEKVAGLDPSDGGPVAALVGEARAIANGHSPRDALRVSHAELQESLQFMVREYGGDLSNRYPGTHRITRDTLEAAHRLNPARETARHPTNGS